MPPPATLTRSSTSTSTPWRLPAAPTCATAPSAWACRDWRILSCCWACPLTLSRQQSSTGRSSRPSTLRHCAPPCSWPRPRVSGRAGAVWLVCGGRWPQGPVDGLGGSWMGTSCSKCHQQDPQPHPPLSHTFSTHPPAFFPGPAGPYSTYEGSPVSKGVLQPDMWGVKPTDKWDWAGLRRDIAAVSSSQGQQEGLGLVLYARGCVGAC